VLSSPSQGLEECFPAMVLTTESGDEATTLLERLFDDSAYHEQLSSSGIRKVLGEHTYTHRVRSICSTTEVAPPGKMETRVGLLAFVHDRTELSRLAEFVESQSMKPHALWIAVRGDGGPGLLRSAEDLAAATLSASLDARVVDTRRDPDEFAAARRIARMATVDYVVCVALQQDYRGEHVESRFVCTRFLSTELVGTSAGARSATHAFTDTLHPHSLMLARTALAQFGWSSLDGDSSRLNRAYRGLHAYSIGTTDFGRRADMPAPGLTNEALEKV